MISKKGQQIIIQSHYLPLLVFFYILKPIGVRRVSNLFILICLSLGMAIIISVLMLEYASRQYCPLKV